MEYDSEIYSQMEEHEEVKTHPQAIYTSRL